MFGLSLGMTIAFIATALGMFGAGGLFMWLFVRNDAVYYRTMYRAAVEEKKQMQIEYNRRLDILGKTLETDTSYVSFGMTDFNFDNVYE